MAVLTTLVTFFDPFDPVMQVTNNPVVFFIYLLAPESILQYLALICWGLFYWRLCWKEGCEGCKTTRKCICGSNGYPHTFCVKFPGGAISNMPDGTESQKSKMAAEIGRKTCDVND
jgi:hypothetical protein